MTLYGIEPGPYVIAIKYIFIYMSTHLIALSGSEELKAH